MKKYVIVSLVVLTSFSLFNGCAQDPVLATGQEVFKRYCATCHQQDGNGLEGAFPSLHNSEWVQGDKGRLIRLTLRGMQGPIVVHDKPFNNVMTPHDFLEDNQIAAVLTFVRVSFGNNADAVSENEVALIRSSLTSNDLYVASELEVLTGFPDQDQEGAARMDSAAVGQ